MRGGGGRDGGGARRGALHPAALRRAREVVHDVVEAAMELHAVPVAEAGEAAFAPASTALPVGDEAVGVREADPPLTLPVLAHAAVVALLTGIDCSIPAAAREERGGV